MKSKPTALSLDLRRRRTELGMTQAKLADALGVHPLTISRWERAALGVEHPRLVLAYLALLELRQQQDRASVDGVAPVEV